MWELKSRKADVAALVGLASVLVVCWSKDVVDCNYRTVVVAVVAGNTDAVVGAEEEEADWRCCFVGHR